MSAGMPQDHSTRNSWVSQTQHQPALLFVLLVHVGDVPGESASAGSTRKGDKKGGY